METTREGRREERGRGRFFDENLDPSDTAEQHEELSITKNFAVGAVAAFTEAVILQPTLYAKNAT